MMMQIVGTPSLLADASSGAKKKSSRRRCPKLLLRQVTDVYMLGQDENHLLLQKVICKTPTCLCHPLYSWIVLACLIYNIFLLLYCFLLMNDLLPGEGFQMLKEEDNRNFSDVLVIYFLFFAVE